MSDDPNVMRHAMLGRMNAANARPVRSSRMHPATEIMEARSTDDEASASLDELSRLQTWCVMQMRYDQGAMAAADLVQRTRIVIIERCKKPSLATSRSQHEGAE